MPSFGFCFASATASSKATSFTIRLAEVRIPSRCARTTASLMECERPKSSALTMSRRRASGRAIVRNDLAGSQTKPGAQDEKNFLSLADASRFGTEDVERARFEFPQQTPINRTHQFRCRHRATILRRQRFARETIEMFRALSHAGGKLAKARRVFAIQNL